MRVTNVFFSHFKSTIRDLQVTAPQDSVCPFATMPLCHIKHLPNKHTYALEYYYIII